MLQCNLIRQTDITRATGWKLKPDNFKLETRQNVLTVMLINHWKQLPKEVVASLFLITSSQGWMHFWMRCFSQTQVIGLDGEVTG